jgi:hypothetical protein
VRALLPAGVVLALVAAVAVAATGTAARGSGETRASGTIIDTIFSLILLAIAIVAVLIVIEIVREKGHDERGRATGRRSWKVLIPIALGILAIVVLFWLLRNWHPTPSQPAGADQPVVPTQPAQPPPPPVPHGHQPKLRWLPIVLVIVLGMLAAVAYSAAQRRRARARRSLEPLAVELAAAFDESLDDLRREADPRRAVIAVYARLERVLASHGVARHRAETPDEYLSRTLGVLAVDAAAVTRLTRLFSQAKFSNHAVGPEMKEDAIQTLEHVRDELLRSAATAEESSSTTTPPGVPREATT